MGMHPTWLEGHDLGADAPAGRPGHAAAQRLCDQLVPEAHALQGMQKI
jgi:hypothetical protein